MSDNPTPAPIIHPCCGCSCSVCAIEHSIGSHTQACERRLLLEDCADNGHRFMIRSYDCSADAVTCETCHIVESATRLGLNFSEVSGPSGYIVKITPPD